MQPRRYSSSSGRAAWVSVAQLLVPVDAASLWGEVVKVPDRFEGADMAGVLPGIPGCVEQFRAPEVADRVTVAVEDVQHRLLLTVGGLGQVVAVIGGPGRGQHAQVPPATLGGEAENTLDRRLSGDGEVDMLGCVFGGA